MYIYIVKVELGGSGVEMDEVPLFFSGMRSCVRVHACVQVRELRKAAGAEGQQTFNREA